MKLQDYDFTLKHIPGKTNTKADILSQKDQVNMKEDNKDVQLLKDEMWTRKTTTKITMLGQKAIIEEGDIIKKIRKKQHKGEESDSSIRKE